MTRGVSFQRIEAKNEINDEKPMPPLNHTGESRINEGTELINEMIKTESDKNWVIPFQLAANQTTINIAIDAIMLIINDNASKIRWRENNEDRVIKTVNSDKLPPITLEVIRDQNSNIEKIKVSIKPSLDLVRYCTNNGNIISIEKKEVVKVGLNYEISLDENNHPIINNLEMIWKDS
jgi:hypothetical protein